MNKVQFKSWNAPPITIKSSRQNDNDQSATKQIHTVV